MYNFLKNLFKNNVPSFTLGSLESPPDSRNIALATFQEPVSLPDEFKTELPPVENQGLKGKCVACAITKVAELKFTKPSSKEWLNLSDDDLYDQCKSIDGIPNVQGTYPSVGAKLACKLGMVKVSSYDSKDATEMKKDRDAYKLTGYAFVNADFDSIAQAIFQNGAICASFLVDSNWFRNKITKVLKGMGRHYTVLNGFKLSTETLMGQNSWGVGWVGYIAGKVNTAVKPGCFEANWQDVKDTITDIIAFTYIPPQIVEDATKADYRFINDMQVGSTGYEVTKLQERLGISPTTGFFGNKTKEAVIAYQSVHLIRTTGNVGPLTRASLNKGVTKSFIPQWIEAIKIMEGAKPYRNNPGNIRFIGQKYAVNDNGYCKFDTYEHGYQALESLLINACTGKSKIYYPTMTLNDFYDKYAPDSDGNDSNNYAKFVAKRLGVSVDTQIKELL